MKAKGVLGKMLTSPGYVDVLKLASSKPMGAPEMVAAGATPNFPP
jgi:hypothetical protein